MTNLEETRQPPADAEEAADPVSPARFLEDLAAGLAGQLLPASPRQPARSVQADLRAVFQRLQDVHTYFQQASVEEITLTYASEWILDNFYIIRQAARLIKEDMPDGFLRQLPKLTSPPYQGYTRAYLIAREFLSAHQYQVNIGTLSSLLDRLQDQVQLTMGEIWALPVFLRLVLLDALARSLEKVVRLRDQTPLPTPPLEMEVSTDEVVASAITGLRALDDTDWKEFFEDVNRVDRMLRQDPAGVYERMDFSSRDLYRDRVEEISRRAGVGEDQVVEAALDLAREAAQALQEAETAGDRDLRPAHIGYYLISDGAAALRRRLGYRLSARESLAEWALSHPGLLYLGSIGLFAAAFLFTAVRLAMAYQAPGWQLALVLLLALAPALTVGTSLTNWLFTRLRTPSRLPKLEWKEGIPAEEAALVAVPALLTSQAEVESLLRQLEMHYLRNASPNLFFALLSDFADAPSEHMPEDEPLLEAAEKGIEQLNERYRHPDGSRPFVLLHRQRRWNPSEGVWMGWERKRGKLHELNRLLRGESGLSFARISGGIEALGAIRYVISLDADTQLPPESALRLVGTMAHPLNRPVFRPGTDEIVAGYSILQPRIEISPRSANRTRFSRIYAGDTGLDLYTLAVSDVYQDWFGEGIFVGKGIYDVDAFERSVRGMIPENTLLSHDLLEGLLGRAGLVTDVTMVEDYPDNYFAYVRRQHRWIRGDWQLLPWLLSRRRSGGKLGPIDRWKIIDNLRRSLLAPALMFFLTLAWAVLPGPLWAWTLLAVGSLAVPMLTSLIGGAVQLAQGEGAAGVGRTVGLDMLRWMLAVVFLPFEALNALDAIGVTLYRLLISRRHLLEWTTAAQTVRLVRSLPARVVAWVEMTVAILWVLAVAVLVGLLRPGALWAAAPLLLLWIASPQIGVILNQAPPRRQETLTPEEMEELRLIARRTWSFFERFVGPEDHWLPPDHFQEWPVGQVAHRTSPTNIGLLLTSTLGAFALGYIDQFMLSARLKQTFDTMDKLERYRGHFLNWIDTVTLQPLTPRYISTVDSGNLAASLIVTAQSLREVIESQVFRGQRWEGLLDTLSLLLEALKSLPAGEDLQPIEDEIRRVKEVIREAIPHPERWWELYRQLSGVRWQEVKKALAEYIREHEDELNPAVLADLAQTSQLVEMIYQGIDRTIHELVPWLPLLQDPPEALRRVEMAGWLEFLRTALPYRPALGEIGRHVQEAEEVIRELRGWLADHPELGATDEVEDWLGQVEEAMRRAAASAEALTGAYQTIIQRAECFVEEMDFTFLYDPQKRIFSIGYNLDAATMDRNYYDLLASEARIASLIAIAKGDAPPEHWLHLNRPMTRVGDLRVLLSWSATMFEYLMPPLFLRAYPETLLEQSAQGAVLRQIEYGREIGLPWGISESGFYRFDANQNYQYRAFGVPGLGFKRGLSDDRVIAPYASLMAVRYQPRSVIRNARRLADLGLLGRYGFYEAVDFTRSRMMVGQEYGIVRSFMSHHQGMILMALVDFLKDGLFVRRMHSDPRIRAVELLLQEQVPHSVPLQNPESENVTGTQRLVPELLETVPWRVQLSTPIPQVHLLSNGAMTSLVSQSGSGFLRWQDVDLTRWQPDAVTDRHGIWIYASEAGEDRPSLWSLAHQPIPRHADRVVSTFHSHMQVIKKTVRGIASTLEVTLSPEDPVEIRRVHLSNPTNRRRRLRLDSYGEVILAPQAADARHPAFNKLFIQSEYIPEYNLLLFRRRPRSESEKPVFLGHTLLVENMEETGLFETDRMAFLGRGGSPAAPARLLNPDGRPGATGATLDPIFSLGQEVVLEPHQNTRLAWLTIAAGSREEVIRLAARYRQWSQVDRAFHQARLEAEAYLRRQDIGSRDLQRILQLLSASLYLLPSMRSQPEVLAANRLGQSGLWRFGISGDYPIILVRVADPQRLELVRQVLQAHRYYRERGFKVDLVLLNQQPTDYGMELNRLLYRLIARTGSDNWLNQRGGIFVLFSDQMLPEERTLLLSVARVVLDDERGDLAGQLEGYAVHVPHLPAFVPSRPSSEEFEETPPLEPLEDLQFYNGYGGFTPDGREYVIDLPPGKRTPLPWVNVIGYPHFGFLVSESGSSCTWALNSGENRLTPWSNDPVSDPTGEALYLRDEETGIIWSPAPQPAPSGEPYRVRHGVGYTEFEHNSHGLRQRLRLFADPQDPVKIIRLRLENTWNRPRRVTATQYVEWVLGTLRSDSEWTLVQEYLPEQRALLGMNAYNAEFGRRVAFLQAGTAVHGYTADRMEFIGRNGSLSNPAGLSRIGLESRVTPGEHPCAVLQVHVDLDPGEVREVYFVLGEGDDREHTLELLRRYSQAEEVERSWQRVSDFWEPLLSTVQVRTPDPAMNLMLNRWLLYQTLSCRIWGRTAFYQSSGAFGFRDQLQDVLALLPVRPEIAREQILNAARHQFEEGDVLHWWHPPSGRGVRTRISDDLLWLPYVVAEYVRVTGDTGLLREEVPFLQAPLLREGEDERYGQYEHTPKAYTIFEHCQRAIERGSTRGPHGLPLMGAGDWNDGMNRVGIEGRGESVWLGWFLVETLRRFAWLCEQAGLAEAAPRYREDAQRLVQAIEEHAWDGEWYLRAFYDSGVPLGSSKNRECQIDSIAQSWSVLSGGGRPERARQAMEAVRQRLVRPEDRLLLLFTPPFNTTPRDPGYIKGYVPGIRENGGQYTHAATWTVWAFTRLRDGDRAFELFRLLNPVYHSATKELADVYKVEPYVIAADVYSTEPHVRRGGWTWYTGSSGWTYRLGLEAILGLRREGEELVIDPVIPGDWEQYEMEYRWGESLYQIRVTNRMEEEAEGARREVISVKLDGRELPDLRVPLQAKGSVHRVEVLLGRRPRG